MPDSFHYHSLPDNHRYFRLLELLPGTGDDLLKIRLRTECLFTAPPYEAISYVWRVFNDDRDHAMIQYDDGPSHLAITWNLQFALQTVRDPVSARLLWTDALCINQSDPSEKNEQIRCMRLVYKNARRVLAWLGDTQFNSATLFNFLGKVAAVCPPPKDYGSMHHDFDILDNFLASADHEHWITLRKLHEDTLFSRIWVVQELNLALDGHLLTSQSKMLLADFRTAIFWINKRRPVQVERFQIPWNLLDPYLYLQFICNDPARLNITNSDQRQPVHYVLRSVRNCASTDPHDKIYAILGHCSLDTWIENTKGHGQIPIDYDLPYKEVYLAVAQRLLEEPQPMLTLSLVDHHENAWAGREGTQAHLPSWVPNWKDSARASFLPNEFRSRYCASLDTRPSFEVLDQRLQVRGCVVDTVTWRSPTMSSDNLRAGLQLQGGQRPGPTNVLDHIWAHLQGEADLHSPDAMDRVLEHFCLTLNAGNRILSQQTYKNEIQTSERVADCVAVLTQLGLPVKGASGSTRNICGDTHRFLATTEELCRGRCFFVTKGGLMGLGPRIMSPGDKVCILFGSQVPFVMRPSPLEQQYRLCGESYIQGIMNGEAIEQLKQGTLTESVFHIN